MLKQRKTIVIVWLVAALYVATVMAGFAIAQKAVPRKEPDRVVIGEADVKQLLLLMDTDKNGKISKQEYMDFMSKEFDRLDKDKSGELDPKELTQSHLRATPFSNAGK